MGYTGGDLENPTYHRLGNHTESLQIDFDPKLISYQKLLEIFWANHNPTRLTGSRQYMPAIFYHDDRQKALATKSKEDLSTRLHDTVQTKILPLETFYWAEDYHQKYWLRQKLVLLNDFNKIYPLNRDFVNSTAAARVNAYIAGERTSASLPPEIDSLGLSTKGREKLLNLVKKN